MLMMDMFAILYIFSLFGLHVSCRCIKEDSAFFVDCSHYHLKEIPQNLPRTTTMLDLNTNKISTIPERIFQNMSDLTWIDLSNNQIAKIQQYSFIGLEKLKKLNLSLNELQISSFENASLLPIKNLQVLRIAGINFPQESEIPTEISHLKNLEILEIEAFIGMQFDERFTTWKSLHTFISLRSFHLILKNETFSGLRNCPLSKLFIKLRQAESGALKYVSNLSIVVVKFGSTAVDETVKETFQMLSIFTKITKISLQNLYSRQKLSLNMKLLKSIEHICLSELEIIGFYNDDIDGRGFADLAVQSVCLEKLKVSLNVYYEFLFIFLRLFKKLKYLSVDSFHRPDLSRKSISNDLTRTYMLPKTLEIMECNNMEFSFLPHTSLKLLGAKMFWNFTCNRCTFKHCHINITGIQELTYLDVSGSKCDRNDTLNLHISTDNLQSLIAANSFVGRSLQDKQVSQTIFSGHSKLERINLADNELTDNSLQEFTFQDQRGSLLHINISMNSFTVIPDVLQNFQKIVNVDLSHNRISTVNSLEREMLDRIWPNNPGILLHDNPFRCTCSNIDFMKWAKITRSVDLRSTYCEMANGERVTFSAIFESLVKFEKRCNEQVWLIFSLTFSAVLVLSIIIGIVYFRYKSAFQYFYLKFKFRLKRYEKINDNSYEYDVFICYNHHDLTWIASFNDKLTSKGYRTCLDAKDFIAGDTIAENILRAIENSRKIIFVITENFLKSEWGNYEMQITRRHAFQEGRDNMVIVVLKDDIPVQSMPSELKKFWFKITCIKYYENGELPFQSNETFYENVYSALAIA